VVADTPRYAQHLSKAEVASFMTPHSSSVEAVESWLAFHNIDRISIGRVGVGSEWVTLRLSVAEAERMLGAKYHIFHHSASGQRVVRTLAYSLPRELHQHIDVIAPTTYFSNLHSMRATNFLQPEIDALVENPAIKDLLPPGVPGAIPEGCETKITPACLRALYKSKDYVPVSTNKNKIGVAGYLNEFASTSDLQVSITRSSNGSI
jgi:tripeptidyl-peptidase-1